MQRIRLCSPPVLTTTERINAWLRNSANPESDAEAALSQPRPSKRRRHSDLCPCPMEQSRPQSPSKRPRVECDELITPTQSASVVGSVTSLTEKTTLSMRSNASRSSSPQRQITQLRTAHPPIFLHPLAAAGECVPAAVALRIRSLQTRLRHRLEREYIPGYLRDALERDPTYKASLLFDPIEDAAYYDEEDEEDEEQEADAALVLDRVKAVFQGTYLCKEHTMDENAWCLHVVTPLLQLAIILYSRGRFRQESVQSQSIQPAYLSTTAPTRSKPTPVFRKTDFCLSYSHLHPLYASLYKTLRHAPISHTTDIYTEAAALFTGIEVKSPSGTLQEAQLQMGIWMAASLRKKAELAWSAFATDALSRRPDHGAFIEPGITIVGTEHKVYYAYLSEPDSADLSQGASTSTCAISILGNDTSLPYLDTSSVQGIFRVARLYGNLMVYAADEDAETGYWGAFLGPVLESLARRVGGM